MSQPFSQPSAKIFISYRREDSAGHAGRLFDRLSEHFGHGRLFMDVDDIEPGEDFVQVIEDAVGASAVLLVVIGRRWLTSGDAMARRLDNPNDFVRLEIAAALDRNIRIIPVLVQDAAMPGPEDLPDDLVRLSRRNAIELSDLRWTRDVDQLIGALDRFFAKQQEAQRREEKEAEKKRQREVEAQRQKEEEERRQQEQLAASAAEEESRRKEAEERQRAAERVPATPEEVKPAVDSGMNSADVETWARPFAQPMRTGWAAIFAAAAVLLLVLGGVLIKWPTPTPSGNPSFEGLSSPESTRLSGTPSTPTPGVKPSPALSQLQSITNSIGMQLVWIPSGSFMMGAENGDKQEKPVHRVTISAGFYLGKYEVTQAQWQKVMGNNPSKFKGCDNCPVEQVSWNDAQEFINYLNSMSDGYKYRLPTEAEWEYACRAGTTTEFAFGDALSSTQANFDGNYPYGAAAKGVYREKTMPVGSFKPNAFGLFDMHGNVWEWVQDYYHENYNGAPTDGSAWFSGGDSTKRMWRGGSWYSPASTCRSASREWYTPDSRADRVGLRVVAAART